METVNLTPDQLDVKLAEFCRWVQLRTYSDGKTYGYEPDDESGYGPRQIPSPTRNISLAWDLPRALVFDTWAEGSDPSNERRRRYDAWWTEWCKSGGHIWEMALVYKEDFICFCLCESVYYAVTGQKVNLIQEL